MKKLIVLLVSLLFVASYANAIMITDSDLITNGDFESPDRASGWGVYESIPGWTTVSGAGIEIETSGVVVNAQSGNQYVELDSHNNSTMVQVVDLAMGSYLLDFWYQPRTNWGDNSNGIFFGIQGLLTQSIGGIKDDYNGWTQFSMAFDTAADGLYNVVFGAEGRSDSYGGFIDNVSLTAAPVPEPSTLLLLGAGLVGLGFYGRKRKKV